MTSSKLSSSSKKNDKWLYYRHVFQQLGNPDDVVRTNNNNDDDEEEKEDIAPLTYAIIDLKAVVKQKNGVTIKPSVLMEESRFYREWVTTTTTTTTAEKKYADCKRGV